MPSSRPSPPSSPSPSSGLPAPGGDVAEAARRGAGRRGRWAGVPAEDRAALRRTLLLDAAFDLLGTDGAAGTTVRAVCRRAGLNPRYFYESFARLDDLVVAVYDRVVGELAAEVGALVAGVGDDHAAHVRMAIDGIVRFVDEDRRRARVLYVEALGNEALNRRRRETAQGLVDAVERDAVARWGAPPPGEQVGRVAAAILVGGFQELLVGWLDGRIDVPRDQLVDDATALFLALAHAAAGIADGRPPGREA